MKILAFSRKKGIALLQVDFLEDLITLKRILRKGDKIESMTKRKLKKSSDQEGKVKMVRMKIEVEKLKLQDDRLRILGRILESSKEEFIPLGAYHTIEVRIGSKLKVFKEKWLDYEVRELLMAKEISRRPKLLLCAFTFGDADFAILRNSGIEYLGSFSISTPPKDAKEYESIKKKFFKELARRITDLIEKKQVKSVICCSVGFFDKELEESLPNEIRDKVFFGKVSTTGRTGINEILRRGYVDKIVRENRFKEEIYLVEKFLENLAKERKCAYGLEEVKEALQYRAVEELLLTDKLLEENGEIVEPLLEEAERSRAKVHILNSKEEPGVKIDSLGGIAAILRFDYK